MADGPLVCDEVSEESLNGRIIIIIYSTMPHMSLYLGEEPGGGRHLVRGFSFWEAVEHLRPRLSATGRRGDTHGIIKPFFTAALVPSLSHGCPIAPDSVSQG